MKKHTKFDEMMKRWPERSWVFSSYRRSFEADIALLLLLGGCDKLVLSHSGYLGKPLDTSGYMDVLTSMTSYPYIPHGKDPLLWAILRKARITFSGGAGNEKVSYAQASWIPKLGDRTKPSIALIVANFWTLKQLIDEGKIVIDY